MTLPVPRHRTGRNTMNWIYFILIGWWLGLLYFMLGLVLCVTIIGLPPGLVMLHKAPKVMLGD